MSEQNKVDPVKVLFPTETVDLGHGLTIEVKPLSLEQLPLIMDAFTTLMSLVDKGLGPSEVAAHGFKEVLLLIPHCINRPANEVPSDAVPEIVDIIIKQNTNEAVIKKWQALTDRLIALGEKTKTLKAAGSQSS